MEKFKRYIPENRGAKIFPLRTLTEIEVPIIVFPAVGKPFAALFEGFIKRAKTQKNNPGVALYSEEGDVFFGGGTSACNYSEADNFPKLKEKLESHSKEYLPNIFKRPQEKN